MRRAWLAPLLLAACGGEGNTGRPQPDIALWSQVPWANYATPQIDAESSNVSVSAEPVYPPIGANTAEPLSRPIALEACAALDEIELSPYYTDSFEPLDSMNVGMAAAWSSYDDGSDQSFRVPGDVDWYPGLVLRHDGGPWGLAADRHVGERPACDGAPNDWVMRYRGGRFNYFGGGLSHPFGENGCPAGSDLCPETTDIFGVSNVTGMAFAQPKVFFDASAYDGVVFWARRGPDGAASVSVALQDKHTSDELARENGLFCKRIKPCLPNCVNGFECTPDDTGTSRCMPPDYPVNAVSVEDPQQSQPHAMNPSLRELLFPRCGASTCVSPDHYKDPDFDQTQCKPYSFSGLETAHWCYGEQPPAAPHERCGDPFVRGISLSTDWQLYRLPFESFRQVGNGKQAPFLDLESLYSISFQFSVGYADVYVDNVSFYRNK